MQQLILFLLPLFVGVHTSLPHEFHVSKCQIEYKSSEQALQISMQIFIDDLELALEGKGHKSLFLCSEKEAADAEVYLLEYLQETFQVQINNADRNYTFIGKETSDDLASIWCYFEITDIAELRHIWIRNSTLMEVFEDQKNIIHVKGPNSKKGYFLLNQQNKKQSIAF